MDLDDLPRDVRVKLDKEREQELWKQVDEIGIDWFEEKGFSRSSIYNWRSKDLFMPAGFVREALDGFEGDVTVKGGGNGKKVELELPLEVPEELYTRMVSVNVNGDGVPVYRPSDKSLVDRFVELLDVYGLDYRIYRRSGREVRFPSVFYKIVKSSDAGVDFAALVDEEGTVENGELRARGESVPVEEFSGDLYSREKRLALALEKGNSGEVEQLMAEEVGRVRMLFDG